MRLIEAESWDAFKTLISNKDLFIQYGVANGCYDIYAPEGASILWHITVPKDGGADAVDFETNYQSTANQPFGPKMNPFASDIVDFKGNGVYETVTLGTTQDVDFKLPETLLVNGGMLFAKDAEVGDYFVAQVVDKDGVYYPAGTVLNEWVVRWYVIPNVLMDLTTTQAGEVPANVYMRVKYTSVGSTNVKLIVNYRLNKET